MGVFTSREFTLLQVHVTNNALEEGYFFLFNYKERYSILYLVNTLSTKVGRWIALFCILLV